MHHMDGLTSTVRHAPHSDDGDNDELNPTSHHGSLSAFVAGGDDGDGIDGVTVDARMNEVLDNWILVVAATNRPWAVDPAILRRLPRQIKVRSDNHALCFSCIKFSVLDVSVLVLLLSEYRRAVV